jgi:hypothetical protein
VTPNEGLAASFRAFDIDEREMKAAETFRGLLVTRKGV